MKTFARSIVVILVAVLALQVIAAPAAHAYVYSSGGAPGTSRVYRGACRFMRTNLNGWLRTVTDPPDIYARNYRYGYGNDSQYVRYRAFLVNAYTGATVDSTGYTAWTLARDNAPAQFTGYTVFDAYWRGNYVVDYRIEWWAGGGVSGWAAQRIDSYNAYYQNVGPEGPYSTCFKVQY